MSENKKRPFRGTLAQNKLHHNKFKYKNLKVGDVSVIKKDGEFIITIPNADNHFFYVVRLLSELFHNGESISVSNPELAFFFLKEYRSEWTTKEIFNMLVEYLPEIKTSEKITEYLQSLDQPPPKSL